MSTAHDDAVDRAGAPTEALALPTVEPTKALLAKMFETIENIGKAEDHLQRKIDAELATADKFDAAGEKREALQCLEKREMYEQQLMTLGTSKMNLESQKLTLESMKMNGEILDAIRVAAKSIQKQIKEMGGVDKEEELLDEVEDVHTRGVSILSELISGMISELIMLDGELQCLEKKEKYEQRLTTLGTSKILLEYQKMILEKHAVHEHELNDFAALREAKKAMQKQGQSSLLGILRGWVKKIGGVDEVEELMDQIEEQIDKCLKDLRTPISDLMLQYGIDADDDELLAELEGLMEEELAADLSKVELGRAVEMPSAPISLPAAGTKKVMTDEERELAELEAAMAG
jgi:charged multivesicular body protein 4